MLSVRDERRSRSKSPGGRDRERSRSRDDRSPARKKRSPVRKERRSSRRSPSGSEAESADDRRYKEQKPSKYYEEDSEDDRRRSHKVFPRNIVTMTVMCQTAGISLRGQASHTVATSQIRTMSATGDVTREGKRRRGPTIQTRIGEAAKRTGRARKSPRTLNPVIRKIVQVIASPRKAMRKMVIFRRIHNHPMGTHLDMPIILRLHPEHTKTLAT